MDLAIAEKPFRKKLFKNQNNFKIDVNFSLFSPKIKKISFGFANNADDVLCNMDEKQFGYDHDMHGQHNSFSNTGLKFFFTSEKFA